LRVVETPGYDMAVAGAYILFDKVGGEFALGSIHGSCDGDTVPFSWEGNDEMSQPAVMAGPNCKKTTRSKGKSVSSTATKFHSSHVVQRLLQQPARGD
jgi:hypothetical protein